MLRKRIGLGRLAHGLYNPSHAQENHISVMSLKLLHKHSGHPSIFVMKQLLGFYNNLHSSLHDCFIYFQTKYLITHSL